MLLHRIETNVCTKVTACHLLVEVVVVTYIIIFYLYLSEGITL